MDKGARVTITDGRQGKGVSGVIFWKGPNKWGEGERLGVRGDDGETYWVADADVEPATGAPPPVQDAGPTFAKGDRVRFKQGGREGTGSVFWTGESRQGPGQRLGIRDDDGEDPVWIDARLAEALTDEPRSAMPPGGRAPVHLGGDDEDAAPWVPSLSEDELPPAAPWDDADVASFAADDDDVPPWEF